jgi:hypothetical protein
MDPFVTPKLIGLGIKTVIGLAILFVLLTVGRSCSTVIGNFWTERDNSIKKTIAHELNAEYQKARNEEFKIWMASQTALNEDMRTVYKQQDDEKREASETYQKEINRDVEGRLDELSNDLKDLTMRMQRATERVLREEENLSDWSTVTVD